MEQIFTSFLLTSLIGTCLALLLVIFKPVTRRVFSAGWNYYIWIAVLIVMLLPIRLTLPEKAQQSVSETEKVEWISEDKSGIQEIRSEIQEMQPEIIEWQSAPDEKASAKMKNFFDTNISVISHIWLMGAMLLFLIKLNGYLIFLIKMRRHSKAIHCPEISAYTKRRVRVRQSGTICSPLLVGIIRPTLLLPETEITGEQLKHILAHEMTHLERNDILYKWLVAISKCIHWFNPAIYYVGRQVNTECEISCDISVVKKMDRQEERKYMETILSLLSHHSPGAVPLTTEMTGNKRTLKRRFTMIKNRFNVSKKAMIVSIVIAAVTLVGSVLVSGLINGRLVNEYKNELIAVNTDERQGDNFNFLIFGMDEQNRADTIMVLSLKDSCVTALSIPRDTAFEYGESRKEKLSGILGEENGDQKVIDAVRNTLQIPITYYAKINLSAVKDIIDNVDGIEFDVPMDMEYDDPYKDLHIKLKQGRHTLSGEEACGLLQFRRSNDGKGYADGDITRIEIGQQFVKEFINQKLNREYIGKSRDIFRLLADNVVTNYPAAKLAADIKLIEKLKSDIEFHTLSGQTESDINGTLLYETGGGEIVSLASHPEKTLSLQPEKEKNTPEETSSLQSEKEKNAPEETPTLVAVKLPQRIARPCDGKISSPFGKREHPITKEVKYHNGIDIVAPEGTEVASAITGVVTETGFDAEKGNYIIVEYENMQTIYSQLESVQVKKGDKVDAHQVIGTVGSTGNSTGAHLHFEVLADGKYLNPENLF